MSTPEPKLTLQQKVVQTLRMPRGSSQTPREKPHNATFTKKRIAAASIGGVMASIGAVVMSMIGLAPAYKDTSLGNLPERIQVFTLIFGMVYTLIAYRMFTYHRRDVIEEERQAELLFIRNKPTWKWHTLRGYWWCSLIISMTIRVVVGFVVVLMINFFWALVILPPINRSNMFQVISLEFFIARPDLIQYWLMGVYGLLFGFALVFMLVGVDDNEHAVGHMVYLTGSLGLMWIVATRQLPLSDVRVGITNVLDYFGAAQGAILRVILPSFESGLGNADEPIKSVSALGTFKETHTLFTLLIIVLGIFTLALARDAVNDWWWLKETKADSKWRLTQGGLWKLRWLITVLLIAAACVAIFPTAADNTPGTIITTVHLIAGLTCGVVIWMLMYIVPCVVPDPYGRTYLRNFVTQFVYLVRFRRMMPQPTVIDSDYRARWLVRVSWFLLLASVALALIYAICNPDGRAIFFIEVVIFPAGGVWTYVFNWYSKHHLRDYSDSQRRQIQDTPDGFDGSDD